jgi:hypothetical protein
MMLPFVFWLERISKKNLTIKEWFEIRKILVRRPKVGFDAIAAWDRQLVVEIHQF